MNFKDYSDNELLELAKSNEIAFEILLKKYEPIIFKCAKKNHEKNQYSGIDINDLINEGRLGLVHAINTFCYSKDVLFYTYAKLCIENFIKQAIILSKRKKNSILNESVFTDDIEKIKLSFYKTKKYDNFNPEKNTLLYEKEMFLLNKAYNVLSNFEFQVYELKKDGFEISEIAQLLGKDYKSIDNALQRIKSKVKEVL